MVAVSGERLATATRPNTHGMDNDPQNRINRNVRAQTLPPGRGLLVSVDGDVEGVLVGLPSSVIPPQQ